MKDSTPGNPSLLFIAKFVQEMHNWIKGGMSDQLRLKIRENKLKKVVPDYSLGNMK